MIMKVKNGIATVLLIFGLAASMNGQPADEFMLASVTDNSQFKSSDAKGKYVALHFLLKTECPICIRHTRDYFSKAERLPNVVQVFIKPDTEEETQAWTKNLPEDGLDMFPIYRDPDARLAKQFNIPDGYEFHNQVVHYPALILLDPEGKEVFRYVGESNRDRYSFEQLVGKMDELTN
jgi:peroxiredoxin Q/BCP